MITRYLLPLLSVAAVSFAALQMSKAQQKPPPAAPPVDPARSPFGNSVAGAGLVEPETENIAVGSHLPGVIAEVLVRVGDRVKPGDPLFRIDDRQTRAELGVRLAAVDAARATLRKLESSPRPEELPPARARVDEARATLDDQLQLYDRVKALSGAVSVEESTRRRLAVEVARAQVERATAELKLLEAGAWDADRLISTAAVQQAEAEVARVRVELERLEVRAPRWSRIDADGSTPAVEFEVLQVNVRPGEAVGTGPGQALVVLGHVGQLHVRVDVDENDIPRFAPGGGGMAKPRGNPRQEIPLRFVRVEPYVIPKKSLTGSNTERVDTRVLQVIYAIVPPAPPLYVGQQLDVFLTAGGR